MEREKVLLAVVDFKRPHDWMAEDVACELEDLISACRGEVVDKVFCRVERVTPAHLIGSGKVEEIANICSMIKVDTVVFSHDLSGSQQRNLEEVIKTKTIDRTQLILDIFARHATSQAGKMQVELAQLEYLLPRLVGQGIALSRLGGGIGTLGPGETKLEVDRRRIGQKISKLKAELKEVSQRRALRRKKRKDKGTPAISLVGYTNAGKSTLLNKLTESNQLTRDGMFTTLDTVSRQFVLPNHQKMILSDTVGFMHNLPHHLIESFNATLEQVTEADLLVHVLDISHPNFRNLYDSVLGVLQELKAQDKPVITVLNKIDKLQDQQVLAEVQKNFENSVAICAKSGDGIDSLIEKISEEMACRVENIDMMIPINRMDLVSIAHKQGQVFSVKYYNESIHIRAAIPTNISGHFYKAKIS